MQKQSFFFVGLYMKLLILTFLFSIAAFAQSKVQCQVMLDSGSVNSESFSEIEKIQEFINSSKEKKRIRICDPRSFNLCDSNKTFFDYDEDNLKTLGCFPNNHIVELKDKDDVEVAGKKVKFMRTIHGVTCNGNKVYMYFDKNGEFISYNDDAKFQLKKLSHFELSEVDRERIGELATSKNNFLNKFNSEVGNKGFKEQEKWLVDQNIIVSSTETLVDGAIIVRDGKIQRFKTNKEHEKNISSFVRQALFSTALVHHYATQTSEFIKKGEFQKHTIGQETKKCSD